MKSHIYMNDFRAEYERYGIPLLQQIEKFFKIGEYVLGPQVIRFEKAFARYNGSSHCVGVGNGLEAIQIGLLSLGIKQGDEVITVSNSDVATALAIVNIGATPVFVDVDMYFHMDSSMVEQAITKRTKAILPVHLFGQIADMGTITAIAKRHNLYVVEDACQAHGATYRGKKAGTIGNVGCFSFYPTKNLGAAGDAGAIVTNRRQLAETCGAIRNRGSKARAIHTIRGINSRLDEIQAVILLNKMKRLDGFNRKRRNIARRYISSLSDIPQVVVPMIRPDAEHVFHQFVIQAPHRDKLQEYLRINGISTLVHYPVPIHKQRSFSDYRDISLPNTERLAKTILSLPVHPFMTIKQVEYVVFVIRRFYKNMDSSQK